MRTIRFELARILNPILIVILLIFSILFVYGFFCISLYPGYAANSPYDVPMYQEMIDKYGNTLSKSEYNALLRDRENLTAQIEHLMSENELFSTYGVTTYQQFDKIAHADNHDLTEDEKKLYDEARNFWTYDPEAMPILFQIQVIDEITRHIELIGNVYADEDSLQNVSQFLSQFSPEARERLINCYQQEELSLLPQAAYGLINDEMPHLIVLSVIWSFVLIVFYQITERLRGVAFITACTKTGRSIFRRQMWSSVVCGVVIGLLVDLAYAVMLWYKQVYLFSDCPISTDMFHFWIDLSFKEFLIVNAAIIVWISAIAGILAYLVGRIASNYIAGIGISIPVTVLFCFTAIKLTRFLLRVDVNPAYFYCKSLLFSVVWSFGGLLLLSVVIGSLALILMKYDKVRDIL